MTDLEKILLGVGGAGALYSLYNADMFAGLNKSKARGLFNVEEPEHWEELVDETINEDGEVIRRKTTEVSPSGEERLVSLSPFGRPPNFPENVPPHSMKEVPDPVQYFRPVNEFTPNPNTSNPEIYFDPRTRTMVRSPGVEYPATLGELRQKQAVLGAINSNPHDPNNYRMRNMQMKNRLRGGLL